MEKKAVLLLGIGNILLGDEGAGCRIIEELERRFLFPENVILMDGGTAGMELLTPIGDADCLIIIDAFYGGYPPGTVVRIEGQDVPAFFLSRVSPHQIGISDVLAAARLSDQLTAEIMLFGIEPESMELGLNLSEPVRKGMEKIIEEVIAELQQAGVHPTPAGLVLNS